MPTQLYLQQIQLSNFRNYDNLSLKFDKGINILYGDNGIGKTNLLEAISLLTSGRGLRGSKMLDLRKINQNNPWAVSGLVYNNELETQIGTGEQITLNSTKNNSASGRRIVKVDGEKLKTKSLLNKYFSCNWLTPQMQNIFIEGNSEKRRFFDRIVSSYDADHAMYLAKYEHLIRERMRLLKQNNNNDIWLSSIEAKAAQNAIIIANNRLEVLGYLKTALSDNSHKFVHAIIDLLGTTEENLKNSNSLEAEEFFIDKIKQSRETDRQSGKSEFGVHKTQFLVTHPNENKPASLCSTGQQKALLISLILAQAKMLKNKDGRMPILLLDEVVTHLDLSASTLVFGELESLKTQCFLSGTSKALFLALEGKAHYCEMK